MMKDYVKGVVKVVGNKYEVHINIDERDTKKNNYFFVSKDELYMRIGKKHLSISKGRKKGAIELTSPSLDKEILGWEMPLIELYKAIRKDGEEKIINMLMGISYVSNSMLRATANRFLVLKEVASKAMSNKHITLSGNRTLDYYLREKGSEKV